VILVTPVPPEPTGNVPVIPATGRPVQFVNVPDDGVPKVGVVNVGLVNVLFDSDWVPVRVTSDVGNVFVLLLTSLFVNVSVVARPTRVSDALGRVNVLVVPVVMLAAENCACLVASLAFCKANTLSATTGAALTQALPLLVRTFPVVAGATAMAALTALATALASADENESDSFHVFLTATDYLSSSGLSSARVTSASATN
jgi:hypothetical protein